MGDRGCCIAGHATRLGRPFADRIEIVVREVVLAALDAAGMDLAEVDAVVTCASDTIDGTMVPVKAEFAGCYGRSILNVPSSAGHALTAAVALIESGQADNLLLVGWGEAIRIGRKDFRRNQADPFYARPIGASPRMSAALQAAELAAEDPVGEEELRSAAASAWSRCWGDEPDPRGGAMPIWAETGFCDGAVALILRRSDLAPAGIVVRDFGSASRPYCPRDERLCPSIWLDEAIAAMTSPERLRHERIVATEVAGPTAIAEARALAMLAGRGDPAGVQTSGGGAAAHFGPATALRQLAAASALLRGRGEGSGAVADLAGPMGQHATIIALEAEAA